MANNNLPVRATNCKTCPFVKGSKYEYLKDHLTVSARTEATRICHSTGANNAINKRTGLPPYVCRGARDVQLEQFHRLGVLTAPTDEAWNESREKIGMPPQVVADPKRK